MLQITPISFNTLLIFQLVLPQTQTQSQRLEPLGQQEVVLVLSYTQDLGFDQ